MSEVLDEHFKKGVQACLRAFAKDEHLQGNSVGIGRIPSISSIFLTFSNSIQFVSVVDFAKIGHFDLIRSVIVDYRRFLLCMFLNSSTFDSFCEFCHIVKHFT